jgi:hypothetical protein
MKVETFIGIIILLVGIVVLFALGNAVRAEEPRYTIYLIHNVGVCRPCHQFLAGGYSKYRKNEKYNALPMRILVLQDTTTIPEHFARAYTKDRISPIRKRTIPTFILYDLTENREVARIEGYDQETFYEQLDVLMEAVGVH